MPYKNKGKGTKGKRSNKVWSRNYTSEQGRNVATKLLQQTIKMKKKNKPKM